jgi:hypothetical protein
MENNYITETIAKIYEISKTASPEELLPLVQNLEEIIKKKIEVDKNISDPNRLQEFGTPEPETVPRVTPESELKPFGTPDEQKSIGGMQ